MKLAGKGTYITAIALILYAVGGYVAGKIDINLAIPEILAGIGMIRARMAIAKVIA